MTDTKKKKKADYFIIKSIREAEYGREGADWFIVNEYSADPKKEWHEQVPIRINLQHKTHEQALKVFEKVKADHAQRTPWIKVYLVKVDEEPLSRADRAKVRRLKRSHVKK